MLINVWEKFLELSSTRSQGFSGPLPITYQEIKSWIEVTDSIISPWEVKAIKRLDRVYTRVVNNGRS